MANTSAEFPKDAVGLTQKLVQIPSDKFSGELKIVDYISRYVAENAASGFKATLVPTIEAARPSVLVANHELPDLIVISHIDTVPAWTVGTDKNQGQYDPYAGTIDDGKLYGRGAADAKHAVAVMLANILDKSVNYPRVAYAFPSDEEGTFLGSIALIAQFEDLMTKNPGYTPQFVLSTNGNKGEISYGCRGLFEIIALYEGLTGHSGKKDPEKSDPINAFDTGVNVYHQLRRILALSKPTHLGRATINAAYGRYGLHSKDEGPVLSYNNVPDIYEAHYEIRTNGGKYPDGRNIDAQTTIELMQEYVNKATLSAKIRQERAAWRANRQDGAWFEAIIRKVTGEDQVKEWVYGEHGYDEIALYMEFFNRFMKLFNRGVEKLVPSAAYGTVRGAFHEPNEQVTLDEIGTLNEVVRQTIISPELRRRVYSTPS